MKRKASISKTNYALTIALAGLLAIPPAYAEKPEWSGDGRGAGREQRDMRGNHGNRDEGRRDDRDRMRMEDRREDRDRAREHRREEVRFGGHFDDHNRVIVRDYYHGEYVRGRCPPGLRKKHNGCMPPGQIRRWQVGHRLPRDVIYYDVPPALIVQLGHPPAGYRYVRVASDILLIAIGTGLVVDAINDLGGM